MKTCFQNMLINNWIKFFSVTASLFWDKSASIVIFLPIFTYSVKIGREIIFQCWLLYDCFYTHVTTSPYCIVSSVRSYLLYETPATRWLDFHSVPGHSATTVTHMDAFDSPLGIRYHRILPYHRMQALVSDIVAKSVFASGSLFFETEFS